ncbi:MAG: MarR family transcriptional regulator [Verrucomicrobiota bacterium]
MKFPRSRAGLRPVGPACSHRLRRSECLACRTLVSIARQRKGFNPEGCKVVFAHLDTTLSIQAALHRALTEYSLSELQFAVLVALFALDPEPVMPADLADYAAVSRAAVTDALVRLETLGFITRTRDTADRRAHHLHLTDRGRTTVDAALVRYLTAVGEIARYLEPATQGDLIAGYQLLQRGAAAPTE